VADQADEQIAEAQSMPTSALAYLGLDPNAWEATPSNGYGYPYDLRTYTSGGTSVYLGLAGGANAPAGAVSLQGADRQQTTQLLAGFLASHGGLSSLAHWVAPTHDYVAMGDSFTSGESNSPVWEVRVVVGFDAARHRSVQKSFAVYGDRAVVARRRAELVEAFGVRQVEPPGLYGAAPAVGEAFERGWALTSYSVLCAPMRAPECDGVAG
jgi:hypothetical protein